jgi:hypothetical protein
MNFISNSFVPFFGTYCKYLVPDSPYSPFPQRHQQGYGYPSHQHGYPFAPSSPMKGGGFKSPKHTNINDDRERQGQIPYSPHYGYQSQYGSVQGYEDYPREASPGKRQRVGPPDSNGEQLKKESGAGGNYPESERYQDPYQRGYFNRSSGNRDYYSESYDSDQHSGAHERQKYGIVPPVSKASSYPPPPSPNRYETAADSSANSYPGTRKSHGSAHGASSDYSYGQGSHHGQRHAQVNHAYDYEMAYHQDSRSHGRYHDMSSIAATRSGYPGAYYYHEGQPVNDEVHPLLRDYDPEKDRRTMAQSVDECMGADKQFSPERTSIKGDTESVATTPSLKSRSSKSASPNKRKPSTTAKAAIAAGMTQPASAREVDFDIHNPPLEPVTQPSTEPACSITSNVNNNDVLCGRGGGTNTQIGNRRFRSLVQEFQPTYLLCRRKEKPLIARTIVLIIRHRGGRFLKKDEGNGMLFEVGDEKAEAKTSQALREGLDVRASKSTTIMGRKKQRASNSEKKKKQQDQPTQSTLKTDVVGQGDDVTISESPLRPQRDGPPPQQEYSQYPPPHFYYGYGGQYPAYQYGYEPNPAFSSPSRKRQRSPQAEPMYYPPPPYNHKGYPPYSYPPEFHYQNYVPATQQQIQTGEENPMWEMDFNPPRGSSKKEDSRLKGEQ